MVGIRNFYAGREFDSFTELSYNRARWYDPSAGRFISEDPIGFAGGDANLYRYAGNSPDNATDPSGNYVESAWDLTSLGVGLFSLRSSIVRGDVFGTVVDAVGVGLDAIALALPLVPGGASLAIKAVRGVDAAVDIAQSLQGGVQAGQQLVRTLDAGVQIGGTALAIRDGDAPGTSLGLVGLGIRRGQLAPLDAVADSRLYSRIDLGITDSVADLVKQSRRLEAKIGIAPDELRLRQLQDINAKRAPRPSIRGRIKENQVLQHSGLEKNKTRVSTSEGNSIPDGLTDALSVEIKDTAKVELRRQLRIQTSAAAEAGRKSVLITGQNTTVFGPVKDAFDDIIRRTDLGPQ